MTTTSLKMPEVTGVEPDEYVDVRIDMHLAQSARLEDYLLGGPSNFQADREAAGQLLAIDPEASQSAVERKRFRTAAMSHLASLRAEQFFDLGCGLPLPHRWSRVRAEEVHQLAGPGATVVHVDRDPMVMAHARALLSGNGSSAVMHLETDLVEVDTVLGCGLFNPDKPLVLAMFDVLHEVEDAHEVVAAYKAAAAPGSLLAISHRSLDSPTGRQAAVGRELAGLPHFARSREEFADFFDSWELLGPRIAPVQTWSASLAPSNPRAAGRAAAYGAIARKP